MVLPKPRLYYVGGLHMWRATTHIRAHSWTAEWPTSYGAYTSLAALVSREGHTLRIGKR